MAAQQSNRRNVHETIIAYVVNALVGAAIVISIAVWQSTWSNTSNIDTINDKLKANDAALGNLVIRQNKQSNINTRQDEQIKNLSMLVNECRIDIKDCKQYLSKIK